MEVGNPNCPSPMFLIASYFCENLAGPILAALIGGPLVAVGFRVVAIPREVADDDARVVEFNMNLRRWINDRDRQLKGELRALVNEAGPRLYSGSLTNAITATMRQALHEYRDEASGRVSEYRALARREGQLHKAWRNLAHRPPIRFWLREEERELLKEWRARPHPVEKERMVTIREEDDPTIEPDIDPLETDDGLIWEDARSSTL